MQSLILDTSTERGILALFEKEKLLFCSQLPFGLLNSQFLLPEFYRGLKETQMECNSIGFIGVGVGPGSYTGIRVGAMMAKALSCAGEIPLIGISSLDIFIPPSEGEFAVIIDAKIGGVYLQINEINEENIISLGKPQVLALGEAAKILEKIKVIIGPNLSNLRPKLEGLASISAQWHEGYPSPHHFRKHIQEKFQSGQYSLDGDLELLYMRKTQAEIELEAKKKKNIV